MGGDNTCKMCADDCKATCLGCWSDLDTGGGYQKRLFSDCCADPGLFVYSCCCPCLLTGQISQEMGRNCCAAPRGRHIYGPPLDSGGGRRGSCATHGRRRREITSRRITGRRAA